MIDVLKYSASFYENVDLSRIETLSRAMDLDLNKKIEDLSYGNKKKVGIVQGLLHEPKLIILDEPTSGLDPLMQQKFFDLILAENKKGATILFSSHILSEVQKLCSRVAIIKEGQIIKVENINDMRNSSYKKITVEAQDETMEKQFNFEGITNLKKNAEGVEFLFKGDINTIIEVLHKLKPQNILIEEPSLEEIFMHYYQKEA